MKIISRTIKDKISFVGKGLHTGTKTILTLVPSNSGKIVFRRLDKDIDIFADYRNIVSNHRNSTIGNNGITVETIEHVMSALSVFGIDSVLIEISGPEVPILDGSSFPYVDKINKIGINELGSKNSYELRDTLVYDDGNTHAIISPSNKTIIDLNINYKQKIIGNVNYKYEFSFNEYFEKISHAKTFVLLSEILFLIDQNLIKGGSIDSAVVIKDIDLDEKNIKRLSDYFSMNVSALQSKLVTEKTYDNQYFSSFKEEICAHKVLDLIGDLSLVNKNFSANIEIRKPGHFANGKIAKLIDENLKKRS